MKKKKRNPSSINWLQVAIESEKAALGDYLEYAHFTKDKTGKNMFIKLARDEFQHMSVLEQEFERVHKGQRWRKIKLATSDIERIVPLLKEKGELGQEAAQNEVKALSMALKAEKKAMGFYQKKAQQERDPAARALLQRLSEMEQAHYAILQAELDYINQNGLWMGVRDISLEAMS